MNATSADTYLVTRELSFRQGENYCDGMAENRACTAKGLGHIDFVILALELRRMAICDTPAISVLIETAAGQRAEEACAPQYAYRKGRAR